MLGITRQNAAEKCIFQKGKPIVLIALSCQATKLPSLQGVVLIGGFSQSPKNVGAICFVVIRE